MAARAKCKLPDKPSALILLALKDLAKIERDTKRYRIAMNQSWHWTDNGSLETDARRYDPLTCSVVEKEKEVCEVCFGGAVMAGTLNVPQDVNIEPSAFPSGIEKKLRALDDFRMGFIDSGLIRLGVNEKRATKLYVRWGEGMPPYGSNGAAFKKSMRGLAAFLARNGF